ncbi:hypothetical protein OIU78_016319 [Salix suchowensis]|nr:hypothetical protein OIU78_016319 [Salix suchowensis]
MCGQTVNAIMVWHMNSFNILCSGNGYMQWMQVILLYSCTWHLSHIQTDAVKALIFGKTFMESILFLAKQFAFEEPSVESISGENILIWPHVFW